MNGKINLDFTNFDDIIYGIAILNQSFNESNLQTDKINKLKNKLEYNCSNEFTDIKMDENHTIEVKLKNNKSLIIKGLDKLNILLNNEFNTKIIPLAINKKVLLYIKCLLINTFVKILGHNPDTSSNLLINSTYKRYIDYINIKNIIKSQTIDSNSLLIPNTIFKYLNDFQFPKIMDYYCTRDIIQIANIIYRLDELKNKNNDKEFKENSLQSNISKYFVELYKNIPFDLTEFSKTYIKSENISDLSKTNEDNIRLKLIIKTIFPSFNKNPEKEKDLFEFYFKTKLPFNESVKYLHNYIIFDNINNKKFFDFNLLIGNPSEDELNSEGMDKIWNIFIELFNKKNLKFDNIYDLIIMSLYLCKKRGLEYKSSRLMIILILIQEFNFNKIKSDPRNMSFFIKQYDTVEEGMTELKKNIRTIFYKLETFGNNIFSENTNVSLLKVYNKSLNIKPHDLLNPYLDSGSLDIISNKKKVIDSYNKYTKDFSEDKLNSILKNIIRIVPKYYSVFIVYIYLVKYKTYKNSFEYFIEYDLEKTFSLINNNFKNWLKELEQ